ncbi:MAG: SURF1 family protein [Alphaproteobacteria bacterium]
MTFRPSLVPTLFTVPALITLIALGFWQLDRLEWKQGLIDRFDARMSAPVQAIPPGDLTVDENEFLRVQVTGTFDHDNEFYLVQPSRQGKPGLHVITPLLPEDGSRPILISRGWMPFERRDRSTRPEGLVEGAVTVTGLLRFPRPLGYIRSLVIPDNEPQNNTWFWLDFQALADKSGYDGFRPYYVMSEEEPPLGVFPRGRQWLLDIRNNHLEYAITWFLLAVALAAIYGVYTFKKDEKKT